MKQLTIREAADFLLRNDNYVLLTHRRPDGDTIGSAAALCAGLRTLGRPPTKSCRRLIPRPLP